MLVSQDLCLRGAEGDRLGRRADQGDGVGGFRAPGFGQVGNWKSANQLPLGGGGGYPVGEGEDVYPQAGIAPHGNQSTGFIKDVNPNDPKYAYSLTKVLHIGTRLVVLQSGQCDQRGMAKSVHGVMFTSNEYMSSVLVELGDQENALALGALILSSFDMLRILEEGRVSDLCLELSPLSPSSSFDISSNNLPSTWPSSSNPKSPVVCTDLDSLMKSTLALISWIRIFYGQYFAEAFAEFYRAVSGL